MYLLTCNLGYIDVYICFTLQLWNQKIFGDFARRAHFSKREYEAVKSTVDVWVPREDDPRKGSHWTAEKMMEDFDDFVATAVYIADFLSSSSLY